MNLRPSIRAYLFFFLAAAILTSCIHETIEPVAKEDAPALIRLNVWADQPKAMTTRATDENAIADMHVLVYNASGNLIGQTYTTGTTASISTRSAKGCRIYAITNTGEASLFAGQKADTEEKLKNLTASISSWDNITNRANMLMVGSKQFDIEPGEQTLTGGISVSRMAAKVTLDIKGKEGLGITITDYQLVDLPNQAYYVLRPLTTEGVINDTQEPPLSNLDAPATTWLNSPQIAVNAATVKTTFYMFENRKGNKAALTEQKDKTETNAPARSSYVLIRGNGPGFTATWRVYLGANHASNFNTKRNCAYTYTITLNRTFADTRVSMTVVDTPLDNSGKANCYIATETQKTYSFDATVMGNGATTPAAAPVAGSGSTATGAQITPTALNPASAELVWETGTAGSVIVPQSVFLHNNRVVFTTANAAEGNAVIAVKNSGGEIIWSWHIWKTTSDPTTNGTFEVDNFAQTRRYTMMNRNLGAANATPGDAGSIGLLYQWGRKDPFPGAVNFGSTISQNSTLGANPPTAPYNTSISNVNYSINNPSTFMLHNSENGDWNNNRQDNLWGNPNNINMTPNSNIGAKSIYDPCPSGWRTPPQDTFTKIIADGENGSIPQGTWNTNGWRFTFGLGLDSWFPASGLRHPTSGASYYAGSNGLYWLSSQWGNYPESGYLRFNSQNVGPLDTSERAWGFSVRCVRETIQNNLPPNATDLSVSGTANSYIVTQSSKAYSFNATVMGNGATTPAVTNTANATGGQITPTPLNPASAHVLWETGTAGSVIYPGSVVVSGGKVYFTTATAAEGNAVIAVKNAAGEIIWSWHIWKTASDPTTTGVFSVNNHAGTRTYQMMNRNLGAANATPGDAGSIGLLYQWGRKDPFPGASSFSSNTPQITTMSNGNPNGSPQAAGPQSLIYSIQNPSTFITNGGGTYDWNTTRQDNAWGNPIDIPNSLIGGKSIYDPCPSGWRVPPSDAFVRVTTTGVYSNASAEFNVEGDWMYGWKFKLNTLNGYYFCAGGAREARNGALYAVGTSYYWHSSNWPNTEFSSGMTFNRNEVNPINKTGPKCSGFSVRCVRETIEDKTDLSAKETANSYIVTASGTQYSFNATVMGNGATTPAVTNTANAVGGQITPTPLNPVSAKVLWETGTAGSVIQANSVSVSAGRVFFTTGAAPEGNAVIAIYSGVNGTGNILWSWHIWKTASDPTTTGVFSVNNHAGTRTYQMMNRNLGAANATPGDAGSIGLLYQWGRKDPFPGMNSFSFNMPQTTTMSSGNPNSSPQAAGPQSITYSIQNPSTFITNGGGTYDWNTTRQDNAWGNPNNSNTTPNNDTGSKSIYDPCPPGWRTPPQDAFTKTTVNGQNGGTPQATWSANGWNFTFGTANSYWFPACGFRHCFDGQLYSAGSFSHYWSSSQYAGSQYGDCLKFSMENIEPQNLNSDDVNLRDLNLGEVNPCSIELRSTGSTVRCVKNF